MTKSSTNKPAIGRRFAATLTPEQKKALIRYAKALGKELRISVADAPKPTAPQRRKALIA